jgi:pimeloyl-ACP methyl ester carboxylesterase
MALFAGAAVGGVALGYLAERRVMGAQRPSDDPEWDALLAPFDGDERHVRSADGTRLLVRERGPATAPVVVLAHGYGLGARFWHHQLRDLADAFRVVAYDQRGHGGSERARGRDYSAEVLGHDLAAVLDAVVPAGRRAVVVGHSMGGMAILALAQERPEVVAEQLAGAVLISTAGQRLIAGSAFSTGVAAMSALEERVGARLLGRQLPGGDVTNDLSFLLTRAIGMHPQASAAHVAFVEQLLIEMPKEAKAAFAHTLGSLDLSRALPRLTVPTLVMVGDRDRLTPSRQAVALASALPTATFFEVPEVGHHLPLEAHGLVTATIRAHARSVLDGGAGIGGVVPSAAPRRRRWRRRRAAVALVRSTARAGGRQEAAG